jgi:hypothetical protein
MPETRTIALSGHDRAQWRPGRDRPHGRTRWVSGEVVPAAIIRPLTSEHARVVRAGWFTLRRR